MRARVQRYAAGRRQRSYSVLRNHQKYGELGLEFPALPLPGCLLLYFEIAALLSLAFGLGFRFCRPEERRQGYLTRGRWTFGRCRHRRALRPFSELR